jgi:hypothetical protein
MPLILCATFFHLPRSIAVSASGFLAFWFSLHNQFNRFAQSKIKQQPAVIAIYKRDLARVYEVSRHLTGALARNIASHTVNLSAADENDIAQATDAT